VNNDDATITFGQDAYFLGFPYGDDTLATQIEDVSVAFVRKATYSAQERGDGWLRIYLDGRNNVGFSGAPVLIYDLSKQGHPLKVIGVVSAYRNEPTEVMKIEPVEEKDITPADRASQRIVTLANGKFAKLIATGNFVLNNSGIVHAYGLQAAIDLIRPVVGLDRQRSKDAAAITSNQYLRSFHPRSRRRPPDAVTHGQHNIVVLPCPCRPCVGFHSR
jgi:hypothetical protein